MRDSKRLYFYACMPLLLFLCLFWPLCSLQAKSDASPGLSPSSRTDVESNINFALDLLGACSPDSLTSSENLVISPVSVFGAMGMVGLGSDGNTKQQFLDVLGHRFLHDSAYQLKALKQMPSQISMANAIFQTGAVRDEFSNELAFFFGAEIRKDMNKVAINNWCSEKTSGKVTDIISDELDEATKAVIVNAIYLKAKWKESFDIGESHIGKFNQIHEANYMRKKSKMPYFENKLFQAVLLPYEADLLEMVVVLPSASSSLSDVIDFITKKRLKNFKNVEVILSLPRMKLNFAIEMSNVFKRLGLVEAFTYRASFPKISEVRLHISGVYHKVTMEVNEEGTVAAAATAVRMKTRMKIITYTMKVDRPFLMIIRTKGEQIPVFIALVNKPM